MRTYDNTNQQPRGADTVTQHDESSPIGRNDLSTVIKAYRAWAEKLRADAENAKDSELRLQMLNLAASLDALVEATEALRTSGCNQQ